MGRVAKLDLSSALTQLRRVESSLSISVHEAMGIMTAVVSAPELTRPSEWLTELFREDGLADAEEAKSVVHSIMAVYNAIVTGLQDGRLAVSRALERLGRLVVGLVRLTDDFATPKASAVLATLPCSASATKT